MKYQLGDWPEPADSNLINLLEQAETATIGHVLHDSFIDRSIQALDPSRRVAGVAVTLRIPGPDSTLLHHLVSDLRPNDIVVIDRAGDDRHACWGGGVTSAACAAGAKAAVVDGPITDASEIMEFGFPIWSRGRSPITSKLLNLGGAMNVPVSIGGVIIRPGDLILADESGVVVLDPSEAKAIAESAISKQQGEAQTHEKLASGSRLGDLSGASDMVRAALSEG